MAVFLCIAELWQPTFISSPVCDIVGDAQRAYRYGDSAKCCAEKTLFAGPGRGVFYELRVTRSDVVSLSLLPRSGIRRGRPVKASRYALRVSRSVVVSLSLSLRNVASESEKTQVVKSCHMDHIMYYRPVTAGRLLGRPLRMPRLGRLFLANHELLTTNNLKGPAA